MKQYFGWQTILDPYEAVRPGDIIAPMMRSPRILQRKIPRHNGGLDAINVYGGLIIQPGKRNDQGRWYECTLELITKFWRREYDPRSKKRFAIFRMVDYLGNPVFPNPAPESKVKMNAHFSKPLPLP